MESEDIYHLDLADKATDLKSTGSLLSTGYAQNYAFVHPQNACFCRYDWRPIGSGAAGIEGDDAVRLRAAAVAAEEAGVKVALVTLERQQSWRVETPAQPDGESKHAISLSCMLQHAVSFQAGLFGTR